MENGKINDTDNELVIATLIAPVQVELSLTLSHYCSCFQNFQVLKSLYVWHF